MSMSEQLQKTIDRYHDLMRQTPNDIGLVTNLAWSYERARAYPEAIQGFKRALDLKADDYNVYYGLGLALMGNGQNDEARDAFVRAEELARDNADRSTSAVISRQVESIGHRLMAGKRAR